MRRRRSSSAIGRQTLRFQSGQDEAVDGRAGPGLVLDGGDSRTGQRQEGPETAILVGDDHRLLRAVDLGQQGFVVGSAVVDPAGQLGQAFGWQGRGSGGIGHVRFGEVGGDLVEATFLAFPEGHGGAVVAAFEEALACAQVEAAADFVAAVTADAVVDEGLADMRLEQILAALQALGVVGRQGSGARRRRVGEGGRSRPG